MCMGCPDPKSRAPSTPPSAGTRTPRSAGASGLTAPGRTHYEVLASQDGLSLVRLRPQTGRTHQLRVHMASIGRPLAGDWLYGTEDTALIPRPALHACALRLVHPVTGELLSLTAPLPEDMARLVGEYHEHKEESSPC